jgi:hypothetical protein
LKPPLQDEGVAMSKFLVEVRQQPEVSAHKRIRDSVRMLGSHFATHAQWSRNNGVCTGTMIVEAADRWRALGVVPPSMRSNARIFSLEAA